MDALSADLKYFIWVFYFPAHIYLFHISTLAAQI